MESLQFASRPKRLYGEAFNEPHSETSPKRFCPAPNAESNSVQKTPQEFGGDMAALLLVAFANHKDAQSPSRPVKADFVVADDAPTSPVISEDPARSDSSSDTTNPSPSHLNDTASEVDEYDESADFESDDSTLTVSKSAEDEGSVRRRVGQHFNKRRHRTSAEQLRVLEMTYAGNKVPNQELRKDLASQLGMTMRRVQIWFQNKRAKEKRLKNQVSSSSSQHGHTRHGSIASSSETASYSHSQTNHRASFSGFPTSSATTNIQHPSQRPITAIAPPTLSGLLSHSMADPNRGVPNALSLAWYYSTLGLPMHHMAMPTQGPHAQPMLYPNVWAMAPLR